MSIEAAIYSLVLADAAVAALVLDRLFPLTLPADERQAAIVYEHTGSDEAITTDGAVGLVQAQFRFSCYAATHASAIELAAALRAALQDYSDTAAGVTVQHVRILSRGDLPALSDRAEQLSRFGKFLDVEFSYEA